MSEADYAGLVTAAHCQLPAYAPELNPVEGMWANMKNGLGNLAACSTPDQLAAIVKNRLKRIQSRGRRFPSAPGEFPLSRAHSSTHRDRLLCDSGDHQSLPLRRHNSDLREVGGLVTA